MARRAGALFVVLLALMLPAAAQQPYTRTAEERQQLDQGKKALAKRLEKLPAGDRADAAVFLQAAEMADRLALYANKGQVAAVLRGLETGLQRSDALAKGERPWVDQPGRSLRGYVSRIDGSVQPYAIVLPAGFKPNTETEWRLDVVLHGRGPTEVSFLQQNEPAPGSAGAKPPDQPFIELHPFGRGNNGWRWAGESDVFEALEQVRKQYRIDPNRIILRGFSMGGHGAWHIGVHYPHLWAAVSPGAGFSETRKYLKIAGEVPAYQEKSWHIYDAVDYALNLFNTPFIAYGGELDPQLQASLNMKAAAEKEGLSLNLIVGPKTEHRYHPDSLKEIMGQLATHRRNPAPKQVKLTTWTLKYNQCAWLTIDALQEHYRRAVVTADASGPGLTIKTENLTSLLLDPFPSGVREIEIDGQNQRVEPASAVRLEKRGQQWALRQKASSGRTGHAPVTSLRKQHGLQGPIDDAFTSRFLVVRGTGAPWNLVHQTYADDVLKRFQEEWRFGFRGEVPVKDDRDVTAADWNNANVALLGDPGSNTVLARILDKLPIRWTRDSIRVGDRDFSAGCVPVLIYPNPLNPERYVVINSGHTFGMTEIQGSNAHLYPRLPDWAVLKPGGGSPEVLAADYFDEGWKFKRGN
jgi:predicted esterase